MIVSGGQQRDLIIYIVYPFSPKLPSHPGCPLTWADFLVLPGRSLLAVQLKYSHVYMSISNSLISPLGGLTFDVWNLNRLFPHSRKCKIVNWTSVLGLWEKSRPTQGCFKGLRSEMVYQTVHCVRFSSDPFFSLLCVPTFRLLHWMIIYVTSQVCWYLLLIFAFGSCCALILEELCNLRDLSIFKIPTFWITHIN